MYCASCAKPRSASATTVYLDDPHNPEVRRALADFVGNENKELEKLLRCVVTGQQAAAQALLVKDSKLLLLAGDIKDLSGRVWRNVTALQLALWARDWHMWRMLLQYLSFQAALTQCQELEEKGTGHGSSFNMKPFLQDLKYFSSNKWYSEDGADDYWSGHVGPEQTALPVHVANEYCHPTRAFNPLPDFKDAQLPRTLQLFSLTFYAYDKHAGGGITRAGHPNARNVHGSGICSASEDALAIEKLWSTREMQYLELRAALQSGAESLQTYLQQQATTTVGR